MWHEYPVQVNYDRQRKAIGELKNWIQSLEERHLVVGYAFEHYIQVPRNPSQPDELRLRFEFFDEKNRTIVEKELEQEVKRLVPDYVRKGRIWSDGSTPQHILQAYEFGCRCAFLAWELVEKGRFPAEYFSNYVNDGGKVRKIPFEFQTHFNHGVMNSLGVFKIPNELNIHFSLIMESTGSRNKQELINWIEKNF